MSVRVAVDIGGAKLAAGLVDRSGRLAGAAQVPTPAGDAGSAEGLWKALSGLVRSVAAGAPDGALVGCGVGGGGRVAPGGGGRAPSQPVWPAPDAPPPPNEPSRPPVSRYRSLIRTGADTVRSQCASWRSMRSCGEPGGSASSLTGRRYSRLSASISSPRFRRA